VRQIADAEAERLGYDEDDPKRPPDFGTRTYVNKRTGETSEVPVGIDPGWAQNPGALRSQTAADLLAGRIDAMSPAARQAAVADLADSWLMKRISSGTIAFDPAATSPDMVSRGRIAVPFAALSPDLAEAVKAESFAVRLSVADATKQVVKRVTSEGEPSVTPADYAKVQALIDKATVIQEGERDLVFIGLVAGRLWQAVIRRAGAAADQLYLKSLYPVDKARLAALLKRGAAIRKGE
jgi:hypothetical protein